MQDVIRATGLVKHYKDVVALDGLDLRVPAGQVLGLLGPNGAGKTTAVRILTTLLEPDEGSVEVAGIDVRARPREVRRRIGLSGQYAAVDEHLTGFENLDMIGRLYRMGRHAARRRAHELLDRFSLTDAGDRPVKTYSGGMRRRLDLAGALVATPTVLFLDEPTTGLDPASRSDMWQVLRELVGGGTTLLLTTQYMEEADLLADEIVVIDHGRAIARGSADQLKHQVGGERIELVAEVATDIPVVHELLSRHAASDVHVDDHRRMLTAAVNGGTVDLRRVLTDIEDRGVVLSDAGLRRPTLDDVFLTLTGHTTTNGQTHDDPASSAPDPTPGTRPPDHQPDHQSDDEPGTRREETVR